MDKMLFRQRILTNKVQRELFRDISFKVFKHGEDKTEPVLDHIDRLTGLTTYIPASLTSELSYQVNALVNAFASLPVSYILKSQFLVSFKSSTGNTAYLTMYKDAPFLAFENLPSVMIPLGNSKYKDKLLDTSNIEYVFLRQLIEEWSFREEPSLIVNEHVISERYKDWHKYGFYADDLQEAIDNGVVVETQGPTTVGFSSLKMNKDFSWMGDT